MKRYILTIEDTTNLEKENTTDLIFEASYSTLKIAQEEAMFKDYRLGTDIQWQTSNSHKNQWFIDTGRLIYTIKQITLRNKKYSKSKKN